VRAQALACQVAGVFRAGSIYRPHQPDPLVTLPKQPVGALFDDVTIDSTLLMESLCHPLLL
jgi:hypothetical protein